MTLYDLTDSIGQLGIANSISSFIFVLENICFMGSIELYDTPLPSVSNYKNVDFVSELGFSIGYFDLFVDEKKVAEDVKNALN